MAVRVLCEFTAKAGDLDLRFTPSPTAQQGMAGHGEVTSRRDSHYQKEVPVSGSYRHLQVRGRADGYDPKRRRLEEIKTHRGSLEKLPANHRQLHWAQAKVYAWLMCQQLGLPGMEVALVYFDIASQQETVLAEQHDAASLQLFFEGLCERYLHWADAETAHRLARNAALAALQFPHPEFRVGQRVLAEAVYKANVSARCLLAQAPTGIGKTMGTLFPTLKAVPGQRLDKVFFLTAKTPGRQLGLDALHRLGDHSGQLPLRVLEMVAKEKACEHPDKACHGDSCPLAKGFYDRLPLARHAAVQAGPAGSVQVLDRQTVRALALQHTVCPYYLGQEMLRWSDVVVGDYNHFFDLNAILYGLTVGDNWRVSILVDEAHNLVARGRQMYTGELDHGHLQRVRRGAPAVLKPALERVHRAWNALLKEQASKPGDDAAHDSADDPAIDPAIDPVNDPVNDPAKENPAHKTRAGNAATYTVPDKLPDKLLQALKKMTADMADFLAESTAVPAVEATFSAVLQDFYFDALFFLRLADLHGPHSLFDVSRQGSKDSVLCLRNVVPAPLLKDRWLACHSATLFSATLSPAQYLRDMLGLPDTPVTPITLDTPTAPGPRDAGNGSNSSDNASKSDRHASPAARPTSPAQWIDVPSAFDARQLQVHVSRHISTRYRDRDRSLGSVVALMAQQYAQAPGNYLAFFSSFEYLAQVADALAALHPAIPAWLQGRRMDESARDAFLARFTPHSQGIGFAVLGGAFGEGIDLPGKRLIGAFIATLGMPQVNPVNEQIRDRMQACLGRGYDYTYLFPGIQKVVQAAGRVIRTPQDTGVVFLMDDRFAWAEVQALLPSWWQGRNRLHCADVT